MSAWATPRRALFVVSRALVFGALLGVAMRLSRIIPDLRVALSVNVIFAGVMWPSFELLAPWYQPRDSGESSPGRMAALSLAKMLALYSALVFLCVVLIRLTGGLDLMRRPSAVLFAYLFGLVITAFMNSLHTTTSLVEAERARAKAAVDRVQISMLPAEAPRRSDVAVAFGMRTATEGGGDYYDVREGADGRLELVLGDATGHGTKAGLLVVAAKTLFQTEGDGTPASALARANRGVKSLNLRRMNMALTRISVGDGVVRLAAAGMPPALHYRSATRSVHEIVSEAPPAGQLRIARYADSDVPFVPGDRLVLFSDGFPECLDPAGGQLGYDAARAAFAAVAERSPKEIVEALFDAADAWARGRAYEDDVSFLVLQAL